MLLRNGYFGEGQIDGVMGIYSPPHSLIKTVFSLNRKRRDKLLDDNEEYKSGFKLANQLRKPNGNAI